MTDTESILVVVAHPDDEILWLAPIIPLARTFVAALPGAPYPPDLTGARELVLAAYPVAGFVFLPLSQADVYRRSDWRRRRLTPYGVSLRRSCPTVYRERYMENYLRLLDQLDDYVRRHAVVCTHNPWGEYGHEEHIQVCHAVIELAKRHHRSVWAWDGLPVTDLLARGCRTRSDFYDPLPPGLAEVELPVDLDLYRTVKELYQRHAAWTWRPTYEPPPTCRYVEIVRGGVPLVDPCPPPVGQLQRIADLRWRAPTTSARSDR